MNEPRDFASDARVRAINELIERYPDLESCRVSILDAAEMFIRCYTNDGMVLTCGNGGSAADAGHIVGELMKGFRRSRPLSESVASTLMKADQAMGERLRASLQQPLPAIDLTAQTALTTAFTNDQAGEAVFAQQVLGYANPANLLVAISTSGESNNVVLAAYTAQSLGMATIALTGSAGSDGTLSRFCDVTIAVPRTDTASVQELHLPVYHALCSIAEEHFFDE